MEENEEFQDYLLCEDIVTSDEELLKLLYTAWKYGYRTGFSDGNNSNY